MSVSLIIVYFI